MGLHIGDIVPRKEISFADLKGKVIAVDAFNVIFQFLSSIRQPDGTPLMDSKGRVTSHLSGLFYRNLALLKEGIRLIYVFDGAYHPLKSKTHALRQEAKDKAREAHATAVADGDFLEAGKYARQLSSVSEQMLDECKQLLRAMGIAVYQAPGEGEMQCAELVKRGDAWAVASQDYDAIAVGGSRLLQNLTLAKTRKTASGVVYIAPELITYVDTLQTLELDSDQLICLAILVGTDFNPGGVRGIGPKKALSLVREKKYPVAIFEELVAQGKCDFDWSEIFTIFKQPHVSKEPVVWPKYDRKKILALLVEEHEFSTERVGKQLDELEAVMREQKQKTLF
ncbi:flap endonuclease-1 [Candidatus Pacearchaeota archaeon]|nr:flap endonuclease-1 [Candidatus Pacearchaeota archaeon]